MVSPSVAHRPSWCAMQTPGFAPSFATHWASFVHFTQTFVPISQIGFATSVVQSELAAHSTHAPLAPHTGSAAFFVRQDGPAAPASTLASAPATASAHE